MDLWGLVFYFDQMVQQSAARNKKIVSLQSLIKSHPKLSLSLCARVHLCTRDTCFRKTVFIKSPAAAEAELHTVWVHNNLLARLKGFFRDLKRKERENCLWINTEHKISQKNRGIFAIFWAGGWKSGEKYIEIPPAARVVSGIQRETEPRQHEASNFHGSVRMLCFSWIIYQIVRSCLSHC